MAVAETEGVSWENRSKRRDGREEISVAAPDSTSTRIKKLVCGKGGRKLSLTWGRFGFLMRIRVTAAQAVKYLLALAPVNLRKAPKKEKKISTSFRTSGATRERSKCRSGDALYSVPHLLLKKQR